MAMPPLKDGASLTLGPAGLMITASGTAANHYHLIIDITAYIT